MAKKQRNKKGMSTKFKVTNICACQNCGFPINLQELWKAPECKAVHDECNVYTNIQPKGTDAYITVFYNGNMICVGNKKISQAKRNLEITAKFLKKFKSTKSFLLSKATFPTENGIIQIKQISQSRANMKRSKR